MGENKGEKHAQGIKQTIETMIGTDLSLKRKKKSKHNLDRETFEKIIITLERANIRTTLVESDLNIDLSKYDESFYEIIDNLIIMHFGKQAASIIFFYVYERLNPNGSINELRDINDVPLILNNPYDLWEVVNNIKNASTKTIK